MISACMLIQLLIVNAQTSAGPRRVMLKAVVLILFSGTKPGVDAMRVASGTERNEDKDEEKV